MVAIGIWWGCLENGGWSICGGYIWVAEWWGKNLRGARGARGAGYGEFVG